MLERIFTGLFLGGFEGVLQQPYVWLFFILFFLFIIVAYKVVKILIRALIIAVISGLFPIFANVFLGTQIPITLENLLFFAMTGVEIYFVYNIIVGFGKIVEFASKPFNKRKEKKVEKIIILKEGKDKHEHHKEKEEEEIEQRA